MTTTMIQNYDNIRSSSCDVVDNKEVDNSQGFKKTPTELQKPSAPSSGVQQLNKERERLATFDNWPVHFLDKRLLARTGLFYIGPNDLVKCYFCSVEIGMWEADDDVVDEHLRWSPNCRLLTSRETDNEPISSEALRQVLPQVSYDTCGTRDIRPTAVVESSCNIPSTSRRTTDLPQSPQPGSSSHDELSLHEAAAPLSRLTHSEFKLETDRLNSFSDWPRSMKQRPEDLSEAGFYYTGKGDRVICFSCGGGLKHWDETDVPWEQHAMWYPKCEYLKLVKGQTYIDEIAAKKEAGNLSAPGTEVEAAKRNDQPASAGVMSKPVENNASEVNARDDRLCRICYAVEYNTVLFPCRHIIACAKCASSLAKCPYCRQNVESVSRVYLS